MCTKLDNDAYYNYILHAVTNRKIECIIIY